MPRNSIAGIAPSPVPVRGEKSVLIGGCGPAQQFEGAEVGRHETETRNPSRYAASGEEEIRRVPGFLFQIEADPEDHCEVQGDDRKVDGR